MLLDDSLIVYLIRFHHFDGMVDGWIELLAFAFDSLQAQLPERVVQPLVDQFHAASIFLVGGLDFERPLEIVQDRQDRPNRFHGGKLGKLGPVPLRAFPEIVEIRSQPQMSVIQLRPFASQPVFF